ncbi:unnamed protein product, partial [Amoebophrya sp. A120]
GTRFSFADFYSKLPLETVQSLDSTSFHGLLKQRMVMGRSSISSENNHDGWSSDPTPTAQVDHELQQKLAAEIKMKTASTCFRSSVDAICYAWEVAASLDWHKRFLLQALLD